MKNIKLFNEYVNEAYNKVDEALINEEKTASEKLADEVSGELYKATLRGNSASVTATTTTQTWDDGVPVLKYLARGKSKPVKMEKKVFNVVHDVARGWFYFTDGKKWFGLHVSDGYVDPSDLPFDVKIAESVSVEIDEMSKFKVGQKIKWSSPKGPKEDEIEKVDGIYLKLKSGGTIPYQSVIAEGVQYATYATPKGTMGRYRLQSDEVDVVKALNLSGFKYGRAFGDEVGFETSSDRNQFIKILDKMHKEDKLSESVVNEAKTSLDDMMKWIENSMKFVRTSEEFDGNDGGIWVSGENGDQYKGKRIYDYYSEDPKNYELGVLKDWEKELNKRGWYSEWYDAGTVMIWPD